MCKPPVKQRQYLLLCAILLLLLGRVSCAFETKYLRECYKLTESSTFKKGVWLPCANIINKTKTNIGLNIEFHRIAICPKRFLVRRR